MSIKPSYAHLILEGSKTIELRRRFSERVAKGTRILIYATNPTKKIIGECRIKEVLHLPLDTLWKAACRDAMVDWKTFHTYFAGLEKGYGIVVHKLKTYQHPISLNSMREDYKVSPPQSYRTIDQVL